MAGVSTEASRRAQYSVAEWTRAKVAVRNVIAPPRASKLPQECDA